MADRTITGLYDLIQNIKNDEKFPTGKDSNPGYTVNSPTGLSCNIDDQLFIVSHPMSNSGSTPTDYVTMKLRFADLAQLLSIALYPTISGAMSTDLKLSALAHQDSISDPYQIKKILTLDDHILDYGPLAVATNKLPNLSENTTSSEDLRGKLGFKKLAFKDKIVSSDISGLIQTSQIKNSKNLISTSSADFVNALNLGELAHKDKDYLELSALAHQNYVRTNQVLNSKDLISTSLAELEERFDLKELAHKNIADLELSGLAHKSVVKHTDIYGTIPFSKIDSYRNILDSIYLTAATSNTFGCIKVGFDEKSSQNDRAYKVRLTTGDVPGNAFVVVPWHYKNDDTSVALSTKFAVDGYKQQLIKYRTTYINGDTANDIASTDVSYDTATIPYVDANNTGLMRSSDYNYLYNLHSNITSNIPLAAGNRVGGFKLGANVQYVNNALHTPVYLDSGAAYISVAFADSEKHGLITSADYNYLHSLKNAMPVNSSAGEFTLPAATSEKLGAVKTGFTKIKNYSPVYLDAEDRMFVNVPELTVASSATLGGVKVGATAKSNGVLPVKVDSTSNAYVQLPTAAANTLGGIYLGFQKREKMYPVQTENGKAYVNVDWVQTKAADILVDLINSLYPVGSIYMTTSDSCPLAAIYGRWEQIRGRYILASGQLGNQFETYSANSYIDAGLPSTPSHTHNFSFGFSSASSTTGYPHHGGANNCKHGSNEFTTSDRSEAADAIYGKSTTVRPKAYVVNVFRRTA